MTALAPAIARPRERSNALVVDAGLVLLGSLLVAGLAQVSIKLPFTPVPITGQTLGVLLVGTSLGLVRGGLALALYLAQGALGLPFFAEGKSGIEILGLASATGGYLWGFLVAALLCGYLAQRGWDRNLRSSISVMLLASVVIYAFGVPWLMAAVDVPLEQALELGLYPFVIGDVLKLLLAAGLLPAAWRFVRKTRGGPGG